MMSSWSAATETTMQPHAHVSKTLLLSNLSIVSSLSTINDYVQETYSELHVLPTLPSQYIRICLQKKTGRFLLRFILKELYLN
jgi:hypothetical protein